jgi:hypothetical protein
MEPQADPQLNQLLREWKVENAPRSLDERVLGPRRPWWRFLLSGSIRVPAPVALAFAAAFLAMSAYLVRARPAAPAPVSPGVDLAGFRPVSDPHVRIVVNRYEAR